jgi:biopolymer transport protein ExbD
MLGAMRWLAIVALLACGCEKPSPPAPCELALAVAPGSYAYTGRLTGRTGKVLELERTLAQLSGETCTAIVTTDGATEYPVFVTLIEVLEDAGLRTAVAVGGGRLAITAKQRGADTEPTVITVVALKDERAYVDGTPIDDADVERGLVSALRRRPEVGLAADVSLRYAAIERAFRAARMAGTTLVRLLIQRATPRR